MSDKALRSALIRLASEKPELRKELLPLLKEGGDHRTPTKVRTARRVNMKMADDMLTKTGDELEKALRACREARRNLSTWDLTSPLLEDWVQGSDIGSRFGKPHHHWLSLLNVLDDELIPQLEYAIDKPFADMVSSWDDGVKHMDPKTGLAYLEKHRSNWRNPGRRP